ncbi:MAG: bifunctional N-acetylglucosamine-1-phosphate uridyltransferase/glucosamine-1-phosphate acetyltransferase [Trueperaceae bacterium]|nr:bifunctional N-acetylglucosamine-1-phosphate uridyltransferase/glucosamine-1-phosphate acetyltransferase [Trueperaceae bacterium]
MRAGPVAAVVFAAGRGTRMRSSVPKVLHEVAGEPLLTHVLRAVGEVAPERCVVVIGHGADLVRDRFGDAGVEFALQSEQLGTGHALRTAGAALGAWSGTTLVVNGDDVLLEGAPLGRLLEAHDAGGSGMTMLTYELRDPTGLGRVVRAGDGSVARIVEERDGDETVRALREINPGVYAFDEHVWEMLGRLDAGNAASEYYLTDVIAAYVARGLSVRAVRGDGDGTAPVGVNDRAQLAQAERIVHERVRARWLEAGVTMHDPATTYVASSVELARDVILEVGVVLRGATTVGEGAVVGAYAVLEDCAVGAGCHVVPHSVAHGARFDESGA